MIVDPGDMELDPASARIVEEADARDARRRSRSCAATRRREPHGHARRIVLRFFASPLEIVGDERVEGVRVGRTELVEQEDGTLRAVVTEAEETIPCQLVFRSVGYRGDARCRACRSTSARATIPNDAGRVLDAPGGDAAARRVRLRLDQARPERDHRHEQEGQPGDRRRAAGGRRRRPAARARRRRRPTRSRRSLAERAPDHIRYAHWEAIDDAERGAGEPHGRPRVKLVRREHLLDAAKNALARD